MEPWHGASIVVKIYYRAKFYSQHELLDVSLPLIALLFSSGFRS